MKTVFLLVISLLLLVSSQDLGEIGEIFSNPESLRKEVDCFIGNGPCTPESQKLKDKIPDLLENGCQSCTKGQKEFALKLIQNLIKNHPELWEELDRVFDPNDEYKVKYADFLSKMA